jgi:hypothetical protein
MSVNGQKSEMSFEQGVVLIRVGCAQLWTRYATTNQNKRLSRADVVQSYVSSPDDAVSCIRVMRCRESSLSRSFSHDAGTSKGFDAERWRASLLGTESKRSRNTKHLFRRLHGAPMTIGQKLISAEMKGV